MNDRAHLVPPNFLGSPTGVLGLDRPASASVGNCRAASADVLENPAIIAVDPRELELQSVIRVDPLTCNIGRQALFQIAEHLRDEIGHRRPANDNDVTSLALILGLALTVGLRAGVTRTRASHIVGQWDSARQVEQAAIDEMLDDGCTGTNCYPRPKLTNHMTGD
jgi:hypothetical protein